MSPGFGTHISNFWESINQAPKIYILDFWNLSELVANATVSLTRGNNGKLCYTTTFAQKE
jgi:hypothetical protein